MKIASLVAKPELIRIELNTPEIMETYGEPIEFWVYDRQPLETYFRLGQNPEDIHTIMDIAKTMILDETGAPVVQGDQVLPVDVAMLAFNEVITQLGKSTRAVSQKQTQTSLPA